MAHGLPSSPEEQEAGLQALAAEVSALLSGVTVRGTTLAMPGGLARAVAECGHAPVVYPLFMADGWFVSRELPRRLAKAGAADALVLSPLGLDPGLHELALRRVTQAAPSPETTVLIAAHGSPSDPRPAAAARALAETLTLGGFGNVVCGFIDEAPWLADAARGLSDAICLPFFARRAGHVENDLPEALDEAGWNGRVLSPIGEDPEVPAIIAHAIRAACPLERVAAAAR